MKKIISLLFCLIASNAHAQQTVELCQNVTVGTTTTCQPLSSTNPMHIGGTISATNLNIGTTTITGGSTGSVLIDTSGILQELGYTTAATASKIVERDASSSVFVNGLGIGTASINSGAVLDMSANTNSMILPLGTTGQRPTAAEGMLRDNSTLHQLEAYVNGAWVTVLSYAYGAQYYLTGEIYVLPSGTDTDIQAACTTAFNLANGVTQDKNLVPHITVNLYSGSTYTLSNAVSCEGEYVNFDGHGAVLNATGIANGTTAISFVNTKGIPDGSGSTLRSFAKDFTVYGTSPSGTRAQVAAAYVTANTTGIYTAGTPTGNPTLTAAITSAGATTFTVSSNANIAATPFSAKIDNEIVLVTDASTTTWTVTRGYAGSTAATHVISSTVFTWHTLHTRFTDVASIYFTYPLSIGDAAFFTSFDNFIFINGLKCVYAANSTNTNYAENIGFSHGVIAQCYTLLYSHQIIRFGTTVSFDYFYNDGLGGASISKAFDLQGGSMTELTDDHIEFDYGSNAADTNNPVHLTGADASFTMTGGRIYYAGTLPKYWNALVYSDNNSQAIHFQDVDFEKVGNSATDYTDDDTLATSADSTHVNTTIGQVTMTNSLTRGFNAGNIDLPACVAYEAGPSWMRGGVGNSFQELSPRITLTGTAAIASQTGSDGTVTPRSGVGQKMLKITGAGKVIITLPIYLPGRRNAYAFFLNPAEAAGTITVSENVDTVDAAWNGSTSLTFSQQTRNSVSGASPYTVPNIASNEWDQVSWKNLNTNTILSSRYASFYAITIDTTSMTGTLYLDDFCFSQM